MQRTVVVTFALLLCLLPPHTYALDQQGKQAGENANKTFRSVIKEDTIGWRMYDPLTKQSANLYTIDNTKMGQASALCGYNSTQNESLALKVSLNTASNIITVSSDTNKDGVLDSTSTYSVTKVCIDGYTVGTPPAVTYYKWTVSAIGVVSSVMSGQLNGCMDITANPATYAGGSISELYAKATGRTITSSSLNGSDVTYYSGEVKDCSNQTKDITATKYYDNPYKMNDAAIQQTITCPETDMSCQAYSGLNKGYQNVSGSGSSGGSTTSVCSIVRNIIDQKGPQNGIICESNKLYFPTGYSDSNKICFKTVNDRWDYNSLFQVRCDSFGKELTLEGWAYWEGAPCGIEANHPPANQIERKLSYGGTSSDAIIGKFSVNYRLDGPNTAYNDLGNVTCYSDAYPMNVHMSHACGANNESCTYNLTVDNAPTANCANFSITITPPTGETIDNGCSTYESQSSCVLLNEWWYDANGMKVQTVSNKTPTNNLLEASCKSFPVVGTVCKEWWRKDREYQCTSSNTQYNPDITRATTIAENAEDKDTGTIEYPKSVWNKENTSSCMIAIKFSIPPANLCGCPVGYTYNQINGKCESIPICPAGSTYNSTTDMCEKSPSLTCPSGYSLDPTTGVCKASLICSQTGVINGVKWCKLASNTSGMQCPDYPWNISMYYNMGIDKCYYYAPSGICITGYTQGCVWGTCYYCVASPLCTNGGTFDSVNDICTVTPTPSCESGYTSNPTTGLCETQPTCLSGGSLNANTHMCEAVAACDDTMYRETQCVYQDPATKTGLYCDINSYPPQLNEVSRWIYRDCIESKQCTVSCVVQIPDINQPEGYHYETKVCIDNGNNTYTCPNGGYTIHKNCDCIIETWDPKETEGEQCDVSCIQKVPQYAADSVSKYEYTVTPCNKTVVNDQPQYTCPLKSGAILYQDCQCIDTMGLSAGVLGAIISATEDRVCQ